VERIDESGSIRVLPSGLITRRDFAAYIGRDLTTVTQWAWQKRGPTPIKIGGRAYYRFAEVQAFAAGKWPTEAA
jgi:hypothetical protein